MAMIMKRSFFDRISGSAQTDDSFDDEFPEAGPAPLSRSQMPSNDLPTAAPLMDSHPEEPAAPSSGELPVDLHQTADEIIIRAFVAGVRPDELSISISRDMVEIEGTRSEREQVSTPDYFIKELFWGSFSRTLLLPQEVDVDAATAASKDGLLTIILPKLDKTRQTKLRVKSG